MRRARISISLLVAFTLVLATTLVLGSLGAKQYWSEHERLIRMLQLERTAAVDKLAIGLTLPVWNFDRPQIDAIIESAMSDNDIYGITVKLADTRGSVHGRIRDSNWNIVVADHEPSIADMLVSSKPILMNSSSLAPSATPLPGEILGEVKIYFTTQFLQKRLRGAAWSVIGNIVAVDAVLIVLLYILLSYLVFKPLRALEQHAAATYAAQSRELAPPPGSFWGELEFLRTSLQGMMRLLRMRYEAMRQSEERYELAVAGTNEGIWDWDMVSNDVYYSPQFRRLLGYTSVAEFPPSTDSFWSHIHRDDREYAQSALQDHLENRQLFEVQYRMYTRSGEPRWFHARAQAIWDAAGTAVRMAGSIADIDKQKRTERSLQLAHDRELRQREEFAQRLLMAQEQERQRLANELHDSVGQNLSLIKNRALLVVQQMSNPVVVADHASALVQLATETIADVRAVAQNLRPLHIEDLGLTDAIDTLLKKVGKSSALVINARLENVDDVIQGSAATHVYRIVQEALNNILKHAHAKHCRIVLERDIRCARLFVADDGIGFDIKANRDAYGLGLSSMAERARILHAELQLASVAGSGTTIQIDIPIVEAAA